LSKRSYDSVHSFFSTGEFILLFILLIALFFELKFTLILLAKWDVDDVDVNGAYLHHLFDDGEKICMEMPQGIEKYYPEDVVLLCERTGYGL